MRKIRIIILVLPLLANWACRNKESEPVTQNAKVQVKVAHITHGTLPDYLQFTGKTVFLNKNTITSPVTGYVTEVFVQPSDYVKKGDTLFTLVSQEVYALRNDTLPKNYGNIPVLSPTTGIIAGLTIFKKPVFVDKNTLLCNIVETNSFFVETEVPYEYSNYVELGSACKIQFPDSVITDAVFYKTLPSMDAKAQTQKILAKIKNLKKIIPENMFVTVLVKKSEGCIKQILPKTCVMTDALMTKYWVMKMINDSTAVQTFVTIGTQNHKQVEILSPIFSDSDLLISEGAYGLEDTVLVSIIK